MSSEGSHYCRAIKQGMVKVNTWVFILRRYKWHIHAGSWSLVNCWREGSTLPYKGCSWILMNAAVGHMDGSALMVIGVSAWYPDNYEELWSRDHLRYRGKCPLLESKFSAFVVEGNYFQYVFARKWVSVCNTSPPSLLAQFILFSRSVWQKYCLIIGFHTKLRDWQHPPHAIGEILYPPLVKA